MWLASPCRYQDCHVLLRTLQGAHFPYRTRITTYVVAHTAFAHFPYSYRDHHMLFAHTAGCSLPAIVPGSPHTLSLRTPQGAHFPYRSVTRITPHDTLSFAHTPQGTDVSNIFTNLWRAPLISYIPRV